MQISPVSLDSLLPTANPAAPPASDGGGFSRSLRQQQDALASTVTTSAAPPQNQSSSREGDFPQNSDNSLSAEKGTSSRDKSTPATPGRVSQKTEILPLAESQSLSSATGPVVEAKALFASAPQAAKSPLVDGTQIASSPEVLPRPSLTSPATAGIGHSNTPELLAGVPEAILDSSSEVLETASVPPAGQKPGLALNKGNRILPSSTDSAVDLSSADIHSVTVSAQSLGSPPLKESGGRDEGKFPPVSSFVTEEDIAPVFAATSPEGVEAPTIAPVLEKSDGAASVSERTPEIDLASAQAGEGTSLFADQPGVEPVLMDQAGALPAASPLPEAEDVASIPERAAKTVEFAAPTVVPENVAPERATHASIPEPARSVVDSLAEEVGMQAEWTVENPVVLDRPRVSGEELKPESVVINKAATPPIASPRTESDGVSIPGWVTAQVVESAIPPVAGQPTSASIPDPVRPVADFTGGDEPSLVKRAVANPESAAPHISSRTEAAPGEGDTEPVLSQKWINGERADVQKVAMSEPQPQPSGNKAVVPPTFRMGERGAEVIESLRVTLPQSSAVQSSPSSPSTPIFDPISASAVVIPPEMTTPLRLREDFRGQRLDTSSDRRFAQLLGETRGAVRVSVAQGESLPVMDAGKGEGVELLFREPGAQVESGIFRIAADNGGSNPTVFSVVGQGAANPQAASAGSGTPGAATPLTLPVPEEQVYQQVASRLTLVDGQRHSRMTMRLYPEELGQVKLDLTVEGDRVRLQLHAQNQQVQEVLEKYLPRLRESFEQQGLKLEEAQVTYDSPGQGGRGSFQESRQSFFAARSAGRSGERTAGEEEPLVTPPPSPANSRPGGISLRV